MSLGILVAFIPLIGWALGDFFIQKTVRKTSSVQSLFYITGLGFFIIFPFAYPSLHLLNTENIFILSTLGLLIYIFAILLFESFKVGKLSVSESIISLELPFTVVLSLLILKEKITELQIFLIVFACVGIFLSTLKWDSRKHNLKLFIEKGFTLALASAGLSAFTNIFVGFASQAIDPFLAIWFSHTICALICLIHMFLTGKLKEMWNNISKNKQIVATQSFVDNIAWTAYAYSVTIIPISISIAISEAYIALAALLGYFINKEKLNNYQKLGMIVTFIAVILLAFSMV